jgi:hypothetical protein
MSPDGPDEETILLAKSQGSYAKLTEALVAYEMDNADYTTVRTHDLRNVIAHFEWLAENRLLELMFHSFEIEEDGDE